MTKSESLINEAYSNNPSLWELAWKKGMIRQLAKAARGYLLSLSPIKFDARIASLAEPATLARCVSSEPEVAGIVEELVRADGSFRPLAAAAFHAGGVKIPTAGQMRNIIEPLVRESLSSIKSSEIVTTVSASEIYSELANILSDELCQLGLRSGDSDEALVLNYAILIYHLHRWKVPFSGLREAVEGFNTGVLTVRGWLISIQNRHPWLTRDNLFFPPVTAFAPSLLPPSIQAHADVLKIVQSESEAIAIGNGFVHRALGPNNPVAPENLALSPIASQELVEQGRLLHYPQYEHTALLFMSLAGIEFLLRSHCPRASTPDQTLEQVIDLVEGLGEPSKTSLKKIFSSDAWNIRNRCMHGSFLELEGRRDDLLRSSGILDEYGVHQISLNADGSLPASVSALVLHSLSDLGQQLENSPVACDRAWANHFLLTPEEFQFARVIHCDLLEDLSSAEGWRRQIRGYVCKLAPCLSIPLQMGLRSWYMDGELSDTLPGFFFLALLFEPLLRLTLHLGGRPILQKGPTSAGGTPHYRVQYRMMDAKGLLATDNIDWLTNHLSPTDKPKAVEILRLAVKCRDAVAHGALWDCTEQLRAVYGHTTLKAVQLVVEAGLPHVTAGPIT